MLHRNLCYIHVFLKSLHRKLLTFSTQVLFIQMKPLTKILAHFKGSECEIAFLKFHLLPHLLIVYIFLILNPYTDICVMCSDLQADSPAFCVDYTGNCANYKFFHFSYWPTGLIHLNATMHTKVLSTRRPALLFLVTKGIFFFKLRPGWAVVVQWGSGLYLSIINFSW